MRRSSGRGGTAPRRSGARRRNPADEAPSAELLVWASAGAHEREKHVTLRVPDWDGSFFDFTLDGPPLRRTGAVSFAARYFTPPEPWAVWRVGAGGSLGEDGAVQWQLELATPPKAQRNYELEQVKSALLQGRLPAEFDALGPGIDQLFAWREQLDFSPAGHPYLVPIGELPWALARPEAAGEALVGVLAAAGWKPRPGTE